MVLTPEGPGLGIFAVFSNPELVLDGLTLFGGAAGSYGGAIYADQATIRLFNSILLSNSSGLSGGAIAVEDFSTLEIINSDLSYNETGGGGGAIYAERSFVTISDSNLSHNMATQGAGIASIQSFYHLKRHILQQYRQWRRRRNRNVQWITAEHDPRRLYRESGLIFRWRNHHQRPKSTCRHPKWDFSKQCCGRKVGAPLPFWALTAAP